jgi:hypothetical protein
MINLILALALMAQDDGSRGPLDAHGTTIYQLSSTDFVPNIPHSLAAGEIEVRTDADWTNTFVASSSLNYYETLHSRTSIWYGVDDRMTVGLSQSVLMVGGGYMDSFINGFHSTFGIRSHRTDYAQDKFLVTSPSHPAVLELPSSIIAGDLMITFQYKAISEDGFGLMFGSQYQFPTGGHTFYYDHRGFGVGVYVYTYCDITDDFRLFGAADLAYVGRGEILWHKLRPIQASVVGGVDWSVAPWMSIVCQLTSASGAADFEDYTSWASEIEAGFRIKLSDRVTIEIAATEHLIRYDNNADFGIHLGLSLKF